MHERLIMAGSGGQGIQYAGQILGLAAVRQGLFATYVPSYGAERRGGPSQSIVVLSDARIDSPIFGTADVLLAFDQRARNLYAASVGEQGIILVNADLAPEAAPNECGRVLAVPASREAEIIRQDITALNLIMLGAYLALGRGLSFEMVQAVLKEKSIKKPKLLQTNLEALQRGLELMRAGG